MPEFFSDQGNGYNTASGVNNHNVTATADPGEEVVSLVTAALPAGKYLLQYSFQLTFGGKNLPAYFKTTGDKADAAAFAISASDNDELHKNRLYGYPFDWVGGVLTIGLNFYIPSGSVVINFSDVSVGRVG